MIEEKVLKDLGLSETESKVYLACLELGVDTVLHITKKAGIKRPTCYLVLDSLFAKGLVTKIEKKNTTLYSAESPKIILNKYKEKIANFEDLIPYFEAKWNKGPKPKIRYYEGFDELWNIYTKIMFPSEELYFFGADIEKIEEKIPGLLDYWANFHKKKPNNIMELISYNEGGINYLKKNSPKWPVKIMPKNLPVYADSAISENKIFIVSLDNMFGVLIESEDLAKSYKNFFLLAWQAAEKIK